MYIRYFTFILADLIMTVIGFFVIPIGLLFCLNDKRAGKNVHMGLLFWPWDNNWDGVNFMDTGTRFWQRYNWLAIRNHTHNFSAFTLGIEKPLVIVVVGDPDTTDGGHAGWKRMDAIIYGKHYFLFYWIHQYKWFPNHCFRLKLGWKLDTQTERSALVYTPSFWHRFG